MATRRPGLSGTFSPSERNHAKRFEPTLGDEPLRHQGMPPDSPRPRPEPRGNDAWAPGLSTAYAATAAPQDADSTRPRPSARPTASAPVKASPAPVVSTGVAG